MKQAALWTALGALFVIPFIPLYVAGDMFFPFITSKGFAFRFLVEIAVASWAILAFADKRYRPQFSWPLILYGGLVLWMAIADFFAVNSHKAFWSNFERMDGWVTLIHVFGFFIVAGSVLTVQNLWRRWWLVFIGASALVVGAGFLQLMGAIPVGQGGVRVDSTFGNASYLAAYLLFSCAVTVWHALESKGFVRVVLWILAPLQLLIIFFTATRGAMLGAMAAVVIACVLYLFEKGKTARRVSAGILLSLLVLVGGFLLVRDSAFVAQDPILSRLASISLESGSTRFTIWSMALEGFAARPITGWGHEGFNYVFNTYYRPSLYGQEPWFDRAHNTFLDWLLSGGAPALLLFVALLISVGLVLYRRHASAPERILLIAALAAYSFQGLFVFDNLFTYVPLAAVLATAHAAASRPFKFFEQQPELPASQVGSIAAPVVLVVFCVVAYVVNVPNMMTSNYIIKALQTKDVEASLSYFERALETGSFGNQEVREQMVLAIGPVVTRTDVSGSVKEKFYQTAITEMGKEINAVPGDARLRLQYAAGFQGGGDFPRALAELEAARTLSPKKQQALTQLGLVLWQGGDTKGAREAFDAAYALDTSFDGLAVYAAAGAIITGDTVRADALLQTHFGTTVVDNQILVFAYYEAKQYERLVAIYQLRVVNENGAPGARFELAKLLATIGRTGDAIREIQSTITDHPDTAAEGTALIRAITNGQ